LLGEGVEGEPRRGCARALERPANQADHPLPVIRRFANELCARAYRLLKGLRPDPDLNQPAAPSRGELLFPLWRDRDVVVDAETLAARPLRSPARTHRRRGPSRPHWPQETSRAHTRADRLGESWPDRQGYAYAPPVSAGQLTTGQARCASGSHRLLPGGRLRGDRPRRSEALAHDSSDVELEYPHRLSTGIEKCAGIRKPIVRRWTVLWRFRWRAGGPEAESRGRARCPSRVAGSSCL
jgi:hypothetical protein